MSDNLTPSERAQLLERVRRAEEQAQECRVEAAVYRKQLVECADLARKAVNDPFYIQGVVSLASLSLQESNIKQWGKEWAKIWDMDMEWLKTAIQSFKDIRAAVAELDVEGNPHNAVLKARISEALQKVLVQHSSSSVSLD